MHRFRPGYITVMICMLLAACAEKAVPVAGLEQIVYPAPGMAKVIVYYPAASTWAGISANVDMQNASGCRLASGNYIVRSVPPGDMVVQASLCNGSGPARFGFKALAGHSYYIQVMPNDLSVAGRLAAYGYPQTQGKTHAQSNGFVIDEVDEQTGYAIIAKLKPAPE